MPVRTVALALPIIVLFPTRELVLEFYGIGSEVSRTRTQDCFPNEIAYVSAFLNETRHARFY